jgi:prefoldin subunit 5
MFKKGEANAESCQHEQFNAKEEVEVTLRKLQILKSRISELRTQCEELKKISSEIRGNALLCSQCGEAIEPGQEIMVKSSGEAEKRQYHKECFKLLWV